MQTADSKVVLAAGIALYAALTGGAFETLPALTTALFLALLIGWVFLDRNLTFDTAEWAVLAVIVWGGAVAYVRGTSGMENKETLMMWMAALAIWLTCRRSQIAGRNIGLLLMLATSLLLSLAVLLEAIGLAQPRAGGFFANANVTAALILPTLAVVLIQDLGLRKRAQILMVTAVVIAGVCVTLTGSRAAALAILTMMAVSVPGGRLRKIVLIGAAVALSVVLIWRFTTSVDSLKWHRTAIWSSLAQMAADHPVMGCGPGGLADSSGPYRIKNPNRIAQYFHRIGSAESTPFGILIRLGGTGMLICLGGLGAWYVQKRRQRFFEHPGPRAACAAMIVFALVHDQLGVPVVLWWWAALIGLMESRFEQTTPGEARPRHWVRGLVATSIALWALAQPAYARFIWFRAPPTPAHADVAWRLEPFYVEPLSWRVHELLSQPEWNWTTASEALHWSQVLVTTDPGKSRLWSDQARVSARIVSELGSYPDSIEITRSAFEKACLLEPHLPWAWLDWAIFERSLGDHQQAHSLAQRAVEAEPNFCSGQLFLARTKIDMGDIEGARTSYDQAIDINNLRSSAFTTYERRLVRAPAWQFEELRRILRPAETTSQRPPQQHPN